jgi:branched-subunit amino acid aminotransferase/4-amino-4-deoxychorismate lyase
MTAFTSVIIDGVDQIPASASIPVTDIGFIRGYGCFEVVRAFDGSCFRLGDHLDRLDRSATMLGIELPDRDELAEWSNRVCDRDGEMLVRLLVSAGDDPFEGTARVVVTSEPAPPQLDQLRLLEVAAPWHSDGATWELLRGKTLSYANNFAATMVARKAGYDDALLIGRSGRVLEGPTFSVGWVVDDGADPVYETPAMELGILDSITRQAALDAADEAGLAFREVEDDITRLDSAREVFALSTLKDAVPVTSVGERTFAPGPATTALAGALRRLIAREVGRAPSDG